MSPRSFFVCLWASLVLPACAAIEHVLLISVDGLRGDLLQTVMDTTPGEVPTFVWLRAQGAASCNARCCATWGFTNGNHVSMVTSRPVLQPPGFPDTVHHGYTDNGYTAGLNVQNGGNPMAPYKASIFDVVHDRGFSTGAYFFKAKLRLIADSYDATYGAPDPIGVDHGRDKIDHFPTPAETPRTPHLVAAIQAGQFPTFSMHHLAECDYAGHTSGWTVEGDPPYRAAIREVDGQIGAVLAAIQAQPAYATRTAIIIVADHGGGEHDFYSHGSVTTLGDVRIPFFLWGPGIPAGSDPHALFENRFEPAATIPSYGSVTQPLRNVDAGNVAAALLGFPPIPGSFVRPVFQRPIAISLNATTAEVRWPLYLTGEILESTDDLVSQPWQPVAGVKVEAGGEWRHTEARTFRRFFRLRSPQ